MFMKNKRSCWPFVIAAVSLSMIGMASITSKGKKLFKMIKGKMKSCVKSAEKCCDE